MRILQLIDSLEAGGAERMSVNYANALHKEFGFSALCASRKEGALKNALLPEVEYLFLNKEKTVDFKALFKLRSFVKRNKIEFIHAHSSSFFLAVLLKSSYPKIRVVWHDHYGNSEFLKQRKSKALKIMSFFFYAIISVNQALLNWAIRNLNCKNAIYLPNFASLENTSEDSTVLQGISGNKILCLANLRPQKGHIFLLEIAEEIKINHPDWTFHLVGKDFKDAYSFALKREIKDRNLEGTVFIYGSKNDVKNIIRQSDICILTSNSEGLPVAILEYGFEKKPVLSTNVGEIPNVIDHMLNGLIAPFESAVYSNLLENLIEDAALRVNLGEELYFKMNENFSESAVIKNYLKLLSK